jgi:hypothetical protein
MTLEDGFRSASGSQDMWRQRQISLYDVVEHFLDDVLDSHKEVEFLDRLNVLITTSEGGVVARQPTTVEELKDFILKTVYM